MGGSAWISVILIQRDMDSACRHQVVLITLYMLLPAILISNLLPHHLLNTLKMEHIPTEPLLSTMGI